MDEVVGFNVGADDYIKKPFSQRLLIERVKALLRRTRAGAPGAVEGDRGPIVAANSRSIQTVTPALGRATKSGSQSRNSSFYRRWPSALAM